MAVKRSPKQKLASNLGFRSVFELDVSKALTSKNVIWEYEPKEKTLGYTIVTKKASVSCVNCGHNAYSTTHNYLPDFYLPKWDIYLEAKGYFRQGAADRKKLEALVADGYKIVVLFQSPNTKLSKGSKTTYVDWADKKGIKWLSIKDDLWIDKLKSIFKHDI
jgi:hypothetical protein